MKKKKKNLSRAQDAPVSNPCPSPGATGATATSTHRGGWSVSE